MCTRVMHLDAEHGGFYCIFLPVYIPFPAQRTEKKTYYECISELLCLQFYEVYL